MSALPAPYRVTYAFTPDARGLTDDFVPSASENNLLNAINSVRNSTPTGGSYYDKCAIQQTGAPFTLSDPQASYNIMEIPYASSWKFLLVQQGSSDRGEEDYLFSDLGSPGTILYSIVSPTTRTYPPPTVVYTDIVQSYVAAGDEFRFGVYLGPAWFYIDAVSFPDTYPVTRKIKSERSLAQGNTISSIYNFQHSTKATLGDQSQTGDEIAHGAKADVTAMDMPNCTLDAPQLLRSPVGFMSNSTNVVHMERLALQPGCIVPCTADTFGTTTDEMDISHIASLWNIDPSWFTTIWDTTQSTNQVLMGGPICPFPDSVDDDSEHLSGLFNLVSLDAMAMKFSFWRGTLRFRINIIGTQYHTGKLWFGVHFGTDTAPASLSDATSQYGAVIDIQQKDNSTDSASTPMEYDIEIPFTSPKPALRVPNGVATGSDFLNFATGVWSLRVMTPLSASSAVASNVELILSRAAAPDLQLHYLGANNASVIHLVS